MPRKRSHALGWVSVGQEVEVKDSYGDWHPCAVTEVVFDDSYEGVKVKYTSWAKRPTEWVDDAAKVRVWFTCILPLYIQRCIYTVYTRIYSPCFPDTRIWEI